jgi:hypothetical protein
MFTVTFYTLTGKFAVLRREPIQTLKQVREAVAAHAATAGFTNVKIAEDSPDDLDGFRFTATSPGGRPGRNIAQCDDE